MSKILSGVACLAVTLLAACVPASPPATESTPQTPAVSRDVQYNRVSSGYYQGTAAKPLIVAQSSTELTAALADITLLGVAPSADFSSQTLIGVLLDTPSSGCENITISTITEDSDHLTVNAKLASAQNSTAPPACVTVIHDGAFAFVTIAKTTKPVTLATGGGMHFDVVAKGIYNGAPQKQEWIIQSSKELDDALTGVTLSGALPMHVDFSTQTLIGVFVAHASACDETVVTTITDDGVGVTVNAMHVAHPDVLCIASIVGGSYVFVTIPKTTKPVTFVITKSTAVANRDVPFKTASSGYFQGATQKPLVVIQSGTELATALTDITILGAAPTADFASETLIGVLVNSAPAGCDNLTVTAITNENDHITVNANISSAQNAAGPKSCTVVLHDGVYAFVTIAKTIKPITLTLLGNVYFANVANGTYEGTPKQKQLVLQSDTELADALAGVTLRHDGQTLSANFSTQTLIGIFVPHVSACEQTVVTAITDDGVGLTVSANHVAYPNAPCVALVVSGSFAFVAIDKTAKPVTFVITDVIVTR